MRILYIFLCSLGVSLCYVPTAFMVDDPQQGICRAGATCIMAWPSATAMEIKKLAPHCTLIDSGTSADPYIAFSCSTPGQKSFSVSVTADGVENVDTYNIFVGAPYLEYFWTLHIAESSATTSGGPILEINTIYDVRVFIRSGDQSSTVVGDYVLTDSEQLINDMYRSSNVVPGLIFGSAAGIIPISDLLFDSDAHCWRAAVVATLPGQWPLRVASEVNSVSIIEETDYFITVLAESELSWAVPATEEQALNQEIGRGLRQGCDWTRNCDGTMLWPDTESGSFSVFLHSHGDVTDMKPYMIPQNYLDVMLTDAPSTLVSFVQIGPIVSVVTADGSAYIYMLPSVTRDFLGSLEYPALWDLDDIIARKAPLPGDPEFPVKTRFTKLRVNSKILMALPGNRGSPPTSLQNSPIDPSAGSEMRAKYYQMASVIFVDEDSVIHEVTAVHIALMQYGLTQAFVFQNAEAVTIIGYSVSIFSIDVRTEPDSVINADSTVSLRMYYHATVPSDIAIAAYLVTDASGQTHCVPFIIRARRRPMMFIRWPNSNPTVIRLDVDEQLCMDLDVRPEATKLSISMLPMGKYTPLLAGIVSSGGTPDLWRSLLPRLRADTAKVHLTSILDLPASFKWADAVTTLEGLTIVATDGGRFFAMAASGDVAVELQAPTPSDSLVHGVVVVPDARRQGSGRYWVYDRTKGLAMPAPVHQDSYFLINDLGSIASALESKQISPCNISHYNYNNYNHPIEQIASYVHWMADTIKITFDHELHSPSAALASQSPFLVVENSFRANTVTSNDSVTARFVDGVLETVDGATVDSTFTSKLEENLASALGIPKKEIVSEILQFFGQSTFELSSNVQDAWIVVEALSMSGSTINVAASVVPNPRTSIYQMFITAPMSIQFTTPLACMIRTSFINSSSHELKYVELDLLVNHGAAAEVVQSGLWSQVDASGLLSNNGLALPFEVDVAQAQSGSVLLDLPRVHPPQNVKFHHAFTGPLLGRYSNKLGYESAIELSCPVSLILIPEGRSWEAVDCPDFAPPGALGPNSKAGRYYYRQPPDSALLNQYFDSDLRGRPYRYPFERLGCPLIQTTASSLPTFKPVFNIQEGSILEVSDVTLALYELQGRTDYTSSEKETAYCKYSHLTIEDAASEWPDVPRWELINQWSEVDCNTTGTTPAKIDMPYTRYFGQHGTQLALADNSKGGIYIFRGNLVDRGVSSCTLFVEFSIFVRANDASIETKFIVTSLIIFLSIGLVLLSSYLLRNGRVNLLARARRS